MAIALLVGLMAGVASANHSPEISGANVTVTEGDVVQITVKQGPDGSTNSNNTLSLQQCQTVADSTPVGASVCATADGKWVVINSTNSLQELVTQFNTTGHGGKTIGFRAHNNNTNENHLNGSAPQDLTIDPLPSGGEHPGCKGIENALAKNNGKANAQAALNAVKAKLDCD